MRTRLVPLPVAFLAMTACNQAPETPQIVLNPGEPTTTDDLSVMFIALTTDANANDAVTHTYQWFQDGTFRADLTTETVPASETTKGETWKVIVVPNDGKVDGAAAEASATVVNTPPAAAVSLAGDPSTDADLVAEVTSEDADADTVTYTFTWTRDGEAVQTTDDTIPASETAHGETWTVTVTPNDGEEDGEPVVASVVVANSAPSVESVELSPSLAYEDSVLIATAFGVDDLDDDGVTLTYVWYVNDTEVQAGEDDTLTGALFDKHDLVRVEVTPTDGIVDGATVGSDDVLVENSVPSGTTVSVVSSSPDGVAYEASTLTCTPVGWSDADGDAEGWTYAWTVDGAAVSTAASMDGTLFDKDDVVACTATPTDGETSGAMLTSSAVSVSNSLPVLASATLSTSAPTESDTLTVTLGAGTDDDGDTVSYAYAWTVDGTLVSTSATLLPSRFVKGDVIQVTVTPYDGTNLGAPVTSATAIAANSAPSVRAVTVSPSAVYTDDTLSASVSTTDLDGDSVSLIYDWTVNGVPVGASGSTLEGDIYFDRDDVVAVTVTPTDGEDAGASLPSSEVTIRNSAPSAPVVAIDPADPEAGDSLFCDVTTDATDADGDRLTYTMSWEQDGAAFTRATTAVWTGDTVAGTYVQEYEAWTCSVTASDGTDTGATGEDSVYVGLLGGSERYPGRSCEDILENGGSVGDGTYWVDPDGSGAVQLYCDMGSGGWTLVANIYDSSNDDAPNATSYVESGWQQTSSGAWSTTVSSVTQDASGLGSSAVGLAFVAALRSDAGQRSLKMCFVHRDGYDTQCRSSDDGSLTLTSYTTGNARLVAYAADTLTYSYGRLAGLAGTADSYTTSSYVEAGYALYKRAGVSNDSLFGGDTPIIDKNAPACPVSDGVWHMSGAGQSYKPYKTGSDELSTGLYSCSVVTNDPTVDGYGFRLYVGP